ncbi:MAG: DUF4296 domain-containing protein [Bacteroidales bacterium]|nr:DUF4296 domain-containing protein [Bacteroidales bacterium]
MRYRHFFIGLLLLLTAFACTKKLKKSELVEVLVDMYIYDQLFTRANLHRQQDSISVYRSVFQKHKCTEKQFRVSINHYSANPKHLQEVYAEADIKIKALKEKYGEVVELLRQEKALQMKMDSLYRYPPDTMYRHIFNHCLLWDMELPIEFLHSVADTTVVNLADEPFAKEDIPEETVNETISVHQFIEEKTKETTGDRPRRRLKQPVEKEPAQLEIQEVR